jgi:hypothetical protein
MLTTRLLHKWRIDTITKATMTTIPSVMEEPNDGSRTPLVCSKALDESASSPTATYAGMRSPILCERNSASVRSERRIPHSTMIADCF